MLNWTSNIDVIISIILHREVDSTYDCLYISIITSISSQPCENQSKILFHSNKWYENDSILGIFDMSSLCRWYTTISLDQSMVSVCWASRGSVHCWNWLSLWNYTAFQVCDIKHWSVILASPTLSMYNVSILEDHPFGTQYLFITYIIMPQCSFTCSSTSVSLLQTQPASNMYLLSAFDEISSNYLNRELFWLCS